MKTQPHHDFYKDRNETEDLIAIPVFGSHVLKLSLIWFQNICKNILTKIILEKKIISSLLYWNDDVKRYLQFKIFFENDM